LAFHVAFAKHDADLILERVSEDIVWNRVGEGIIRGKAAFAEVLGRMAEGTPATRLEIANIITHGNTASANGVITYGRAQTAFCDVYRFNSLAKHAKIKEITTYAIPLT
jgi:limonene-1,2-epoxide hydrolase